MTLLVVIATGGNSNDGDRQAARVLHHALRESATRAAPAVIAAHASSEGRRFAPRVKFERPIEVRVMTIDGTWSVDGTLIDVSESDARLWAPGALELTEFFLMMTWFGSSPVHRYCRRLWVDGEEMGVSFGKVSFA